MYLSVYRLQYLSKHPGKHKKDCTWIQYTIRHLFVLEVDCNAGFRQILENTKKAFYNITVPVSLIENNISL